MQSLLGKFKRKNAKSSTNEKRDPLIAKESRNEEVQSKNTIEPRHEENAADNQEDGVAHPEEHDDAPRHVVQHEEVVAVIVHRTDRIKSKLYISHPTVKIHVINSNTGEYLKKSVIQRPGSYNFEKANTDHLLPLMTKPSTFRSDDINTFPTWEELLLFNESYGYITKADNQVLFIFEMLDFMSMEALKAQTNVSQINAEDGTSGWYRIAWAFLKVVSASGEVNCGGKKLRLQLYRAPRKTRMKDDKQTEVFHWYKHLPKIKYPGSLYVTVKPTVPPGHVPRVTRSMFAVQPEGAENGIKLGDNKSEEKLDEKIEEIYLWSRLPGQPCKVPNKQILSLAAGKLGCFSVQFSNNGRLLACAGCETQRKYPIYLYSIPDGLAKGVCFGHVNLVYELRFNLNSNLLLSASADCTARLWEVSTCFCIQTFPHTTFVYCAKFHPANENLIVTGCFDKRIRLWQTVESLEGQVIQEFEAHVGYVNAMCFSIDGLTLFSGDGSGYVRIWDTPPQSPGHWTLRKEIKEDEFLGKAINNLILHPDQKRLLVQSRDGGIRILDLRAYALRHRFTGFENNRLHLRCTITPCGTFLLAGSETGKVVVWHIQTGKVVTEYDNLRVGDHPITSVAYHLLDHIVAFAVFAEAQLVLVYKFDISVPELYKEDNGKLIDVQPAKPSFDPDFSVTKLLEEHRILMKYEMGSYQRKTVQQPSVVITGDDSDDAKSMEPIQLTSSSKEKKARALPSPRRKQVSFKSPSQSPEVAPKLLSIKPEIQIIAPKPLKIPSLADQGREPSMLEKRFSVESEEEEEAEADETPENQPADDEPIVEEAADPSPRPEETNVLFAVKAKHNYTAQNQDEISFNAQDVINVISNEDPNWYVGFVEKEKVGYFPSNYVEDVSQIEEITETEVVEI